MGKKKANKGTKLSLGDFLGDKAVSSAATELPTVSRSRVTLDIDMYVASCTRREKEGNTRWWKRAR